MALYDDSFYDEQEVGSLASARVIVPFVIELLKPKSVVDIGCGRGTWLSIYQENGIEDFLGFDGSYVDQSRIYIDKNKFVAHDLSEAITSNRQFDLVQSLEVAEHVDASHAAQFIETLTSLGSAVLFAAAIPYQLGTGHVNEQFVDYWASLFAGHDFYPVDCIRPRFWSNQGVEVWYRQNIILYLRSDIRQQFLHDHPSILDERLMSVVHPELFAQRITMLLNVLSEAATQLHTPATWQTAENLYRLILHHNARRADAHAALGQLLAQTSRLELALESLNNAVEINGEVALYFYTRGLVHSQLNNIELAAQDFKAALGVDGTYQAARDALAKLPRRA